MPGTEDDLNDDTLRQKKKSGLQSCCPLRTDPYRAVPGLASANVFTATSERQGQASRPYAAIAILTRLLWSSLPNRPTPNRPSRIATRCVYLRFTSILHGTFQESSGQSCMGLRNRRNVELLIHKRRSLPLGTPLRSSTRARTSSSASDKYTTYYQNSKTPLVRVRYARYNLGHPEMHSEPSETY